MMTTIKPLNTKFKTQYFKGIQLYFLRLLRGLINKSFDAFPELALKTTQYSHFNLIKVLTKHSLIKAQQLNDITVIDYPNHAFGRFLFNYVLSSLRFNARYRISFWVAEYTQVISLSSLFQNALWFEREVWDLFGVFFKKHKDLRRILTDYGFKGYPLRKDFPLIGFLEVHYKAINNKILYTNIPLLKSRPLIAECPHTVAAM